MALLDHLVTTTRPLYSHWKYSRCYMYFWCQLSHVMISFGGCLEECLPCYPVWLIILACETFIFPGGVGLLCSGGDLPLPGGGTTGDKMIAFQSRFVWENMWKRPNQETFLVCEKIVEIWASQQTSHHPLPNSNVTQLLVIHGSCNPWATTTK